MLQKAYFLEKIGADTAENEQHFTDLNLPKTGNVCLNFAAASGVRGSAFVLLWRTGQSWGLR